MALDFAERYEGREPEVLKEGRAGRWFLENGEAGAFEFVADVGASETVARVLDGRLLRVEGREHNKKLNADS
jgi:2-phosphosulfolactate phosphatase